MVNLPRAVRHSLWETCKVTTSISVAGISIWLFRLVRNRRRLRNGNLGAELPRPLGYALIGNRR